MGVAQRRDIPWALWIGCFAAAVLAHAALMVPGGRALARSLGGGFEPRGGEREAIELELIEADERRTTPFVEVDQSNDRAAPTERVAERDSDVEHEQVAAAPVRTKASVAGGSSGSTEQASQPVEPQPQVSDAAPPEEDLVAAADGRMPGIEPKPVVDEAERLRLLAGSPSLLGDHYPAPRPSPPELERGPKTVLDSRAHLYAGFFTRVHERILEHYDVQGAMNRHDPRGLALADAPRMTVLRVQLDRSGAITKLSFIEESEVEYLDAEAVRTIRAAGPYPNPPDGLFDASGTLVIHVGFKVNPDGSAQVVRHSK